MIFDFSIELIPDIAFIIAAPVLVWLLCMIIANSPRQRKAFCITLLSYAVVIAAYYTVVIYLVMTSWSFIIACCAFIVPIFIYILCYIFLDYDDDWEYDGMAYLGHDRVNEGPQMPDDYMLPEKTTTGALEDRLNAYRKMNEAEPLYQPGYNTQAVKNNGTFSQDSSNTSNGMGLSSNQEKRYGSGQTNPHTDSAQASAVGSNFSATDIEVEVEPIEDYAPKREMSPLLQQLADAAKATLEQKQNVGHCKNFQFDEYMAKAAEFTNKGAYEVSLRLYSEAIASATDMSQIRKAKLEQMLCFVHANRVNQAVLIARQLDAYGSLSSNERAMIEYVKGIK